MMRSAIHVARCSAPHRRRIAILICMLPGLASFAPRAMADTSPNLLRIISPPGEPVAHGQSQLYTAADASFTFSTSGGVIQIFVTSLDRAPWPMYFRGPNGQPLRAGGYSRVVASSQDHPSFSIGRGCADIDASWQVRKATYSGGALTSLWVMFLQYCNDEPVPLSGELRLNADTAMWVGGPVDTTLLSGQPVTFEVAGADTRGHPVQLTASGLPIGAAFTDHGDGTGTFIWGGALRAETATVVFTARNDSGQVVTSTSTIRTFDPDLLSLATPAIRSAEDRALASLPPTARSPFTRSTALGSTPPSRTSSRPGRCSSFRRTAGW